MSLTTMQPVDDADQEHLVLHIVLDTLEVQVERENPKARTL